MAFVTDIRNFETNLAERASAYLRVTVERFAKFRMYRRTIVELSALSNADLEDLGLSRSTIKSTAFDAVYGV